MSPDSDESDDPAPRSEPAPRTVAEERSLDPMRRTIAKRLHESYSEAVHVTASREVDAEGLLAAREAATERHDVDVTLTDLLLSALSSTLDEHPGFNATFEDDVHTVYAEHNVGVAVDVDAGLLTPVLADVGEKSLAEIAAERASLTDRVRAGDHSMSDLRGGTVTLSNLGPLGVDAFTPIINPPEVAILGVDRIRERAVSDGDGGVEFRREIRFDLSFDHRVVDGADAGRFLGTLAEAVEGLGDAGAD